MRPTKLLDINIPSHCNEVHIRRYATIFDAVDAAITEIKITVTALGRALRGHADEKRCVKRMDLLIGNTRCNYISGQY